MIRVQTAGFSDIGKVRKANEDSLLLNEPIGLYVVADGMGGHRGGGVASRIAVETIDAYMTAPPPVTPDVEGEHPLDHPGSEADRLRDSIVLANQKIYAQSASHEAWRGMGTTVSALYLTGKSIFTANVGDSPIYLVRNGEIEALYTPHNLLHERRKVPKSMESRLSSGKLAHILTRAVGIRSDVSVDLVETPCFEGDIIILCSDGLSGKISMEEIRDLACQNDSQTACRKLIDMANQRGGEDNITIIVVKVTSTNGESVEGMAGRYRSLQTWIGSLFSSKFRSGKKAAT